MQRRADIMKRKTGIWLAVPAFLLVLSVLVVGHFYFISINQTIFDESSAHLSEIYYQTNQSFSTLVDHTWE